MAILQARYWSGLPCPPPGDRPKPGIKLRSPAFQAESLSPEPLGKPKNTEVGSLSLLQLIFPTQELNRGLQHCRPILYQLNYEGSLNAGDLGLIPGLGRSPGGGHGNPLQYLAWEIAMDRGA